MAWAALVSRLPALRRNRRDAAVRSYSLAIFFLALSLSFLLPPVYLSLDQALGIPNLARLLAHGSIFLCCWFVQQFLFHLNYAEDEARLRSRSNLGALLGAAGLLVALFVAADIPDEALDFTTRYADTPFIAEYRLVLLGYIAFTLVNIARLSWRYAHLSSSRPALDWGLRLVAAGAVVGLVYIAHGTAYLASRRIGLAYPLRNVEFLSELLVAVCVGLVVIGSTMPAWGPRLGIPQLHRWFVTYRICRKLYPLWRDLCRAVPQIALVPPSTALADALSLRRLRFRLYRRVVEIRDGQLALRTFFHPGVGGAAELVCQESGLGADDSSALAEATQLWLALQSRAAANKTRGAALGLPPGGGDDMQSEASFLARVAAYYARPDLIREVIARLNEQETASAALREGTHS